MKTRKQKKNNKYKGNVFTKILIGFSIIGILAWIGIYALNYIMGEDNIEGELLDSINTNIFTNKKDVINALICGSSEYLTDTMIYVRYEVLTGKLAFMSIPRDTYVNNEYCIGHKLNAIYRGINNEPLIEEIEGLLDVDIDYYLFVDTKIVREVVDAMGGVEIDVPFRMKYDDYTQDLHINLYPGIQVLNGDKAEQFLRFRHNNDMTVGYATGDIGRTKAQQDFIKAFVNQLILPSNIFKLPDVINIALNNTDTNVTVREALKYVTDIPNLEIDSMYSCTAVGTTPYINGLSYFKMDEEATREVIKENFFTNNDEILVDETEIESIEN